MLIKEAIDIICKAKGVFIVKKFIKNHKKATEDDLSEKLKQKYFCKGHNKCHKYTFHSYIEWIPGSAFFLGLDTTKEVVNYAKTLKIKSK